jgi:hypothetical protein
VAGGDTTGIGERGNRRTWLCFFYPLFSLFVLDCALLHVLGLWEGDWVSFEAKRTLFLLRSWLPHSPFGRAFSTMQAMISAIVSRIF